MNQTASRFTYSFFILLFFLITPVLLYYALGYRYNWSTHAIEKRGAFYVKSYPRGADIFVDNKKMRQKTPTQLIDVSSGLYTLTVAKDSYVPWQKKLSVYAGETTFAEDIVLFLEKREKTLLGAGGENVLINRTREQYAFLEKDNTLTITDIEQIKTWPVFKLNKKYKLLDWSADNQRLLLDDGNNYFVFDINKKELSKLPLMSLDKIIWDDRQGAVLWYLKNQILNRYQLNPDAEAGTEKIDLAYAVNDFDLENNWLVIQYSQPDKNFVQQINLDNMDVKQTLDNVNLGDLKIFLANDKELVFALGSQLYIKVEQSELISIPYTNAEIHDQRLLLTNGYEIILYNFQEHWQVLIDRSTQVVTDILWHPNGSYFISESNDHTYLSEIDGRDVRNTIDLISDPHKKSYLFNKKGDKLFVLTPDENFYLTIQ